MPIPLIAGAIAAAPAIGAAAMKYGPALLGAIPLVQDIFKSGADPEKIAGIKKMRDDRIEQIVGSMPGMDRNKATAQANQEFQEMISHAEGEGKATAGELAGDVATLAGGIALGKFARGKLSKKTDANAPTTGGPATASEKINGVDTAAKPAQNAMVGKVNDAPEVIHNPIVEKPQTGFQMNSPRLTMDGATGGTQPLDDAQLRQMMMKAQLMKRARGNPGMSGVAIPMGGEPEPMLRLDDSMGRQIRAQGWTAPSGIPTTIGQKFAKSRQQQMDEMFAMRDAGL